MNDLVIIDELAGSVDRLLATRNTIQDAISRVFVQGQHYGVIPGTKEKTLLKPGAEALCLLFRFSQSYDTQVIELADGHREVRVTCRITTRNGIHIAEGHGVCTTRETKYAYRSENTGAIVPSQYWQLRKTDPGAAQDLIGGAGYSVRKKDDTYFIFHQADIGNPADNYHTVQAMADKRALVAATRLATAASDSFAPDPDEEPQARQRHAKKEKQARAAPIDPEAESNDRKTVLLAALERAAESGESSLMESWQDLGENDRVVVGKDFSRLLKFAKEHGP